MAERVSAEEALAACASAVAQAAAAAAETAKIGAAAHVMAAEALRVASVADSHMESHEKLCALREEHRAREVAEVARVRESMHVTNLTAINELKNSIRRLYGLWWKIAASIIFILLSIIGFLLAKHGI